MWRVKFLEKHGFEHLIHLLHSFKYDNNNGNNMNINYFDNHSISKPTQQLALTSILKMVDSFFVGAISCLPEMNGVVNQIHSLTMSANEIIDNNEDGKK